MIKYIAAFLAVCSFTVSASQPKLDDIIQSVVVVESLQNNQIQTIGTGFYFEPNYIITNYHVVKDHKKFAVRTYSEFGLVNATLVGYDRYTDLAILETKETAPKIIPLKAEQVTLGEDVYVIGHPFGYEFTISKGIVSSLDRYDLKYPFINYIQTDANVQSGSSGSPVLNQHGRAIGIIKATVNSNISAGISLALSLPLIVDSISKIKEQKIVERPGLIFMSDRAIPNHTAPEVNLNLKKSEPAQNAHIYSSKTSESELVLHSINGIAVKNTNEANLLVQKYKPGDTVQLTYRKNNIYITHSVTLSNLE